MTSYLGNYNDILAIMHGFVGKVMETHDAIATEAVSAGDGAATIRKHVQDMAAIFKGQNPDYEEADYLSEAALAGKIVGWVPGIDPAGDIIAEFFERIAKKVIKVCQEVQDGMAEEQAGPELQWLIRDIAQSLVGAKP